MLQPPEHSYFGLHLTLASPTDWSRSRTQWRDYIIHLAQDQIITPQKGLEEVVREVDVLASLFSLLPM